MKASVGIDVRMWRHAGIGRYLRELTNHLLKEPSDYRFTFLVSPRIQNQVLWNENVRLRNVYSDIYSVKEQLEIPWRARGLNLLHAPHFNIPIAYTGKLVVTIHDLIYLRDPLVSRSRFARFYTHFLLKAIEKKSLAIIAVSEHTKKDILEHFPKIKNEKIFVIPEAVSDTFRKIEDKDLLDKTKKRHGLFQPFVLFVGTFKKHKNLPLLITALKRLRENRGISHELVWVGRKDAQDKEALALLSNHSFVRYLGEVEDNDLVALYNLADTFVFPSRYEGFGLPALEAMACGTPVVTSQATSIPEVVGDAAQLFDVDQVDALEEPLYNVLQNKGLREKMSRDGLERAKQFSWKRTAQETLEVYRRILGS